MISKGGQAELAEAYRFFRIDCDVAKAVGAGKLVLHLWELRGIYPDIRFVFDTKMAAFHGQLDLLYEPESEWLWREGYIQHYHVNNYAGGYMDWCNLRTLPVGKGKIDFERFFDFVNRTDYAGDFTAEGNAVRNDGTVDVETLNEQFRRIRKYLQ